MEIKVNKEALQTETQRLQQLLERCRELDAGEYEIRSRGKMAEGMKEAVDAFGELENALYFLINSSTKVLEQAEKGYLQTDEALAGFFREARTVGNKGGR